jgi:hypothetical protein
MKPWIWLRVASVIFAVISALHGFGYIAEPDGPPEQKPLTDAMKNFNFDLMGTQRNAWDFFRGFDLALTLTLALFAVMAWLVSTLAKAAPERARPFVWTLLLAGTALAWISWTKFFIAPGIAATLAAAAFLAAAIGLHRSKPLDTP